MEQAGFLYSLDKWVGTRYNVGVEIFDNLKLGKLLFSGVFDGVDQYVSGWLLIRHALRTCHLPAACGITWEGSYGVFLVDRKTFKYQYVFSIGERKTYYVSLPL